MQSQQSIEIPSMKPLTLDEEVAFTTDWWNRCLKDNAKFTAWFQKLQLTEIGGYVDYLDYMGHMSKSDTPLSDRVIKIFTNIAEDERKHSNLMLEFFKEHGIRPVERSPSTISSYWTTMNSHIQTEKDFCAVNFFGEALAAFRFEVIHSMPGTPKPVKDLLDIVLPDEQFHRETLMRLAGEEALEKFRPIHLDAVGKLRGKY